ncbi:hypothetical protein ACJMK2_029136 [Sinanodonta woodiana]|uniref:Uncharacterized protein n=1 Tax=Sinanodonta woodiana TaxID=1069815 RepID=A0ABD3X8Z8_SINWO
MEAVVIINPASEYNAATERISTALKTLKKELISLRLQDVDILKQLISINETIKTMSTEERTKRNYRHNFHKHATNLYATYSGGRLPMAQRQTHLVRQQSVPRYCTLLPQRHSSNTTEEFNSSEDETGSSLGGSTESVSELNDSVSDIPVFSLSTATTRPRSLSVRFNQTRTGEEEIKRDDSQYEEILKRNILLWKVKSRKVDNDSVFSDSESETNETEC